jgi:hypothetical protein
MADTNRRGPGNAFVVHISGFGFIIPVYTGIVVVN